MGSKQTSKLRIMFRFLSVVAVLALAVVNAENVRMEPSVDTLSSKSWLKEKIDDNHMVKAVFVLKHSKEQIKAFDKTLLDRASPKSRNYGKWLNHDDIKLQFSPREGSAQIVTEYLASHGVTGENVRVSRLGDMIHVQMPAKTANEVLGTEFALFRSVIQRNVALPRITKPYYLPAEIADVVTIVDDIMRFPTIRMSERVYGSEVGAGDEFSSCGAKCSGFTTPDVLQARHNYPTLKSAARGNSMSVAEFQLQYYDQTDLDNFSKSCDVTVTVDDTVGGNVEQVCNAGGCVEALLDIEYIGAVANPIPLTVIYSSSYSLLDWVDQLMAMDSPPLVNSVSYGNDEVQQESVEYMEACNTEFMKAGAMGLSILFASGDQGVWGRSGVGSTYHPDFPAASPYVTAVGGTDFAEKSTIGDETTWSCGGGGFSDTFETPEWQSDVVSAYLKKAASAGVLPDSSLFNAGGRAYPDVAALGGQVNPYCVSYRAGSFGGVSGTSASAPVVAGIFALLNDVRLSKGMSSLGWLNPLIYENGACFNDVADGSENNCNRGTDGFAALSGWDPATGFGSPNYECLSKVVLEN